MTWSSPLLYYLAVQSFKLLRCTTESLRFKHLLPTKTFSKHFRSVTKCMPFFGRYVKNLSKNYQREFPYVTLSYSDEYDGKIQTWDYNMSTYSYIRAVEVTIFKRFSLNVVLTIRYASTPPHTHLWFYCSFSYTLKK